MLEDGTHLAATQEEKTIGGWDMQDAMAMRWTEAVEESNIFFSPGRPRLRPRARPGRVRGSKTRTHSQRYHYTHLLGLAAHSAARSLSNNAA